MMMLGLRPNREGDWSKTEASRRAASTLQLQATLEEGVSSLESEQKNGERERVSVGGRAGHPGRVPVCQRGAGTGLIDTRGFMLIGVGSEKGENEVSKKNGRRYREERVEPSSGEERAPLAEYRFASEGQGPAS